MWLAPAIALGAALPGFAIAHVMDIPPAQMTVTLLCAALALAWAVGRRVVDADAVHRGREQPAIDVAHLTHELAVLVEAERVAGGDDADALDAPHLDVALLRDVRSALAVLHLDGARSGDVHGVRVAPGRRGERLEADDLPGAGDPGGADLRAVAHGLAPHLGRVGAAGHGLEREPLVGLAHLDGEVADREVAEQEQHLAGLHEGLAYGRRVRGELRLDLRRPARAALPVGHVDHGLGEIAALAGAEHALVAGVGAGREAGGEVHGRVGSAGRERGDAERRRDARCKQGGRHEGDRFSAQGFPLRCLGGLSPARPSLEVRCVTDSGPAAATLLHAAPRASYRDGEGIRGSGAAAERVQGAAPASRSKTPFGSGTANASPTLRTPAMARISLTPVPSPPRTR